MSRKLFILVVVILMICCLSSTALAEDDSGEGGDGGSAESDVSTLSNDSLTQTKDNETLDTSKNEENTFTILSSGSGGGSGGGGGDDEEGDDLGSASVIDPVSATVDLADEPEPLTLTATTEVYEIFTGSKGNMDQVTLKEVTEDWQGDYVYSNNDGYWASELQLSVTGSGNDATCTVTGTWVSTAYFDHDESGTGTFYVDYSVLFDFYLKPQGQGEEKPYKSVQVDAETATIEVIDSRECPYTSEDIKGNRAAPGVVNFILKDLGYYGQPRFGQGEDPGYAGEKGTILSTVGKSMKEEDLGDRKDDYDLYIENVYFTFFDLF